MGVRCVGVLYCLMLHREREVWRWLVLFDVAQRKGGVALALNTPAVSYIVIVTGARDWLLCMTSRAHCRNRCIQRDAIKRRSLAG